MTPAIVRALQCAQDSAQLLAQGDNSADLSSLKPSSGEPITHEQIIELSKALKKFKENSKNGRREDYPPYSLEKLLRGSRVYIEPAKPKAEPTSEYKALMARLRREEEAQAYERMINPPTPAETFSQRFPNSSRAQLFPASQADVGEDDEISYADINRQMALIINISISIVACSVAIWLAARHWSTPSRLGLSMGGSSLVGVAEVVIYAGYLRKLKEAREKGKKEVEIKEIVKTWVIGRDDEKTDVGESVPINPRETDENRVRRRLAPAR